MMFIVCMVITIIILHELRETDAGYLILWWFSVTTFLFLALSIAKLLNYIVWPKEKHHYVYKDYVEVPMEKDLETEYNYEYSWLMVNNEKIFYTVLFNVLQKEYGNRYAIMCQVRMQDLFKKRPRAKLIYQSLDFLIVDLYEDFEPVLAIELDWDSHLDPHQKILDQKKEKLISICPFNIIRVRNEDNMDEKLIYELIIPELAPLKDDSFVSNLTMWFRWILYIFTSIYRLIKNGFIYFQRKRDDKKLDDAYKETWISRIDKEFIMTTIKENNNSDWEEKANSKNDLLIFKILLLLFFSLLIFTIISAIRDSLWKKSKEVIDKISNQENKKIEVIMDNGETKKEIEPIIQNGIVAEQFDLCKDYIDSDEITSSDKFKCYWNIFYSNLLNACIKNELCEYTNNEKRYYIHNLSAWEYIFSCYQGINWERKNYKITTPEIRDIIWPWDKQCSSLYWEIFRKLQNQPWDQN